MSSYEQQDRGDLAAYARYLANMDAAMRQKVALTAAHLPCHGKVADMGMGSGAGSQALAALYPRLQVEGVDVNPRMVELAQATHQLPNLAFRLGDVAQACFAENSLDAVINSSVLHHVTSYNGYDYQQAARALEAQVQQLRWGGTLIVRDFLAPQAREIEMVLQPQLFPLWVQFCEQFRALLPQPGGVPYQLLDEDARGWRRLRTLARWANEFVLRKDYQQDWASEIQEEYAYFTQPEFEAHFRRLGLRVLISTPLHNPWIVENRFQGQFEWRDPESQERLDFPPTNYLIVGEKVAPGRGVEFRASCLSLPVQGFLKLSCYRHQETGRVYDLVCRPHPSLDVVPFHLSDQGNVTVLVRHSYPRPILALCPAGLDGFKTSGYSVEPISVIQSSDPLGETVEKVLQERAGVELGEVTELLWGDRHFPSPGGLREEVIAAFARLDRIQEGRAAQSGLVWSEAGQIRALDAHQLLRSAQVHGLPDHRLEMHIFALMRKLEIDPGPWLGDRLEAQPALSAPPTQDHIQAGQARAFVPCSSQESSQFLKIVRHRFEELDSDGQVLASDELESIQVQARQLQTMAVLPMLFWEQEWWVGLDRFDLPAAQAFTGNSRLWLAPAWRLPVDLNCMTASKTWIAEQMLKEFGAETLEWAPLGGPYFPSPGLTAELVYPMAVRVKLETRSKLIFFRLHQVMRHWESFQTGHLRCLLLRSWLAHR